MAIRPSALVRPTLRVLLFSLVLGPGPLLAQGRSGSTIPEIPGSSAPADLAGPGDLAALRTVAAVADPDRLLRITLYSRDIVTGYPVRVEGDTLLLAGPDEPAGLAAGAAPLRGVPLAHIALIEQRRSGAGKGGTIGMTIGGTVTGFLGALMGMALAGLGGGDNTDVAWAGFAVGAMGAVTGTAVFGGIGAGIGSLTEAWYRLYPGSIPGNVRHPSYQPKPTLLALQAGMADAEVGDRSFQAVGFRAAVLRRISSRVSLGPALGFYNLDPSYTEVREGSVIRVGGGSPVLNAGLDILYAAEDPGFAPYAVGGVGWYTNGDVFLGGMLGGGLGWRDGHGRDYSLEARYNHNLSGDYPGFVNRFWTLSLGITFGL